MADSQRSRGVPILSAPVALVFLGSGAAKLIGAEPAAETFARFGFGMGFMRFIGAAEVAGAAGPFLPRLAPLAAARLMPILCGAVYHQRVHDPIPEAVPPALLLVLCA